MVHFFGNPNCPARHGVVTDSEAPSEEVFRSLLAEFPRDYCSACVSSSARSDSDRYAELRKLVEAWQSHTTGSSQTLAEWRHR